MTWSAIVFMSGHKKGEKKWKSVIYDRYEPFIWLASNFCTLIVQFTLDCEQVLLFFVLKSLHRHVRSQTRHPTPTESSCPLPRFCLQNNPRWCRLHDHHPWCDGAMKLVQKNRGTVHSLNLPVPKVIEQSHIEQSYRAANNIFFLKGHVSD